MSKKFNFHYVFHQIVAMLLAFESAMCLYMAAGLCSLVGILLWTTPSPAEIDWLAMDSIWKIVWLQTTMLHNYFYAGLGLLMTIILLKIYFWCFGAMFEVAKESVEKPNRGLMSV